MRVPAVIPRTAVSGPACFVSCPATALFVALVAASPAVSRQVAQVPDEAVRQWRAYLDRFAAHAGMTVETDAESRTPDGTVVGEPTRVRLALRPGAIAVDDTRGESPKRGHVVVATNPDYGFRIQRKRADAPWVLADAAPNDGGGPFWQNFTTREATDLVHKAGLTLGSSGEVLTDLIGDKEFVVTGVAQEVRDGVPLTRVAFRNTPRDIDRVTEATATRPPRQIDVVSGHVLLDPARSWLIHSYSARMNPPSAGHAGQLFDATATYAYTTLRDGLPVVERVEHRFQRGTAKDFPIVIRTVVRRYDEAVPPAADFRLPKYGLPEPFGLGGPTRWYLWAVAAAIVLFLAGAFFRRRANQSAAAR